MAERTKSQRESYLVRLPGGLGIQNYDFLDRRGRTTAYSRKQAVSHVIARQNPGIVKLVMHKLNEEFGDAGIFARPLADLDVEIPVFNQTEEDLIQGELMTYKDCDILRPYALAYQLAQRDNVALIGNKRFYYLDLARDILRARSQGVSSFSLHSN